MKKLSLFIILALLITAFMPTQVGATETKCYTDLAISKFDNPDPVNPGHDLTYTINIANNGTKDACDVYVFDMYPTNALTVQSTVPSQGTVIPWIPQWVLDILDEEFGITTLPPGYSFLTWDVGYLANGASASLTIVTTVNPDIQLPEETPIVNQAGVVSSREEPNWNNNIVEIYTNVEAVAEEPVPTTLTLEPESAINQLPAEPDHTLTLTVLDQYGQGMVETVSLSSVNGTLAISEITTGSDGTVTFTISSTVAIADTITATSTTVPILSDTATKTWVTEGPVPTTLTLEPGSAINQLPTQPYHTLTLTVLDQYGQGMVEAVSLSSVNGTLAISEITTGSNGTVTFTISSTVAITDTITATSITVPTLSDTATKTWFWPVLTTTTPPTTTTPLTSPPPTILPTKYFTVDFLGRITRVEASQDGRPLEDIVAYSPDNAHVLEIKAGTRAIDKDGEEVTYITIRQAAVSQLPQNTVVAGEAFDITPSGTAFDRDVILTLGFKVEDLPDEFISIGMAYYNPDFGWRHLDSVRNQVAGGESLTSVLGHLTVFAILVEVPEEEVVSPPEGTDTQPPPAAASFALSNLSITTSESKTWRSLTFIARYGEDAEITLDVTNTGEQAGTYQVFLLLNGARVDTATVELGAGETQHVVFNVTGNEPGIYTVQVGELTGEFESRLWINWWLMIGFTVAFILLVWLVIYLIRARARSTIKT